MINNKLQQIAKEVNASGTIPFMENRTKGEELPQKEILTIDDFGYIKGENGEFVVLSFKEKPEYFYFGGGVVTDKIHHFDGEDNMDTIREDGLPVLFEKKINKKGKREYMNCEFYPESF